MWICGLDWAGPGQRQVACACECGNEASGSVKCGEFLEQRQTGQLLEKDCAPWSNQVWQNKIHRMSSNKLSIVHPSVRHCIVDKRYAAEKRNVIFPSSVTDNVDGVECVDIVGNV